MKHAITLNNRDYRNRNLKVQFIEEIWFHSVQAPALVQLERISGVSFFNALCRSRSFLDLCFLPRLVNGKKCGNACWLSDVSKNNALVG